MAYMDPTMVFKPWNRLPPTVAPPLNSNEIEDDTDLTRYFQKNYINPARFNVKMEIHISSSLNPEVWQRKVGEYLQGGHHGKIFQNELDTTAPQNVGHAIMSTSWLNVKALGKRLS